MWPATRCVCFPLLCFNYRLCFVFSEIWRRCGRLIDNCALMSWSRLGVLPTTLQTFRARNVAHNPEKRAELLDSIRAVLEALMVNYNAGLPTCGADKELHYANSMLTQALHPHKVAPAEACDGHLESRATCPEQRFLQRGLVTSFCDHAPSCLRIPEPDNPPFNSKASLTCAVQARVRTQPSR